MRVQSIWTAIQIRYPACDRFFRPPRQVPLGEVDRIAELHHVMQKIRPVAEALQNARHLLAARLGTPLVVDFGDIAGRIHVFNQLYLRRILSHGGKTIGTTISRWNLDPISTKRLIQRMMRTSPCLCVIRSRSNSSSSGIACFRVNPVRFLNAATSTVFPRIADSRPASSRIASE